MAATGCFFLVRLTVVTRRYFTWLVNGGWEHSPLAWCDRKNLMHAEIKQYSNVGIHNNYALAITVIGTIRYYRTEYIIENSKLYHLVQFNFFCKKKEVINTKLP
jgi:hypothetical protein